MFLSQSQPEAIVVLTVGDLMSDMLFPRLLIHRFSEKVREQLCFHAMSQEADGTTQFLHILPLYIDYVKDMDGS